MAEGRNIGLDVVRSAAILLVLFSHYINNISFWFGYAPPARAFYSGDLGVDLFFALSGLLIGRILLDVAAADPSWRNLAVFMVRRWMRTLPLYWLWLLVSALAFPPAAGTVWRYATLTQNLVQPMPASWWFGVSWSLTVEEWFYLLAAAGLIGAAAAIRRPWAIWLPLGALLVAPLTLRLAAPEYADPQTRFVSIAAMRLDEIGYGVALAWLHRRGHWMFERPALPLVAGLLCIAAAWLGWLPFSARVYEALRVNVAIVGCVLCLPAALRLRNLPHWLARAARTLSRWSYSLYLIHLTILVDFAQGLWWAHRISTAGAVAIALVLPFVGAALLSRWVEQPIMRLRPPQPAGSRPHRHATARPTLSDRLS